jgi:hypothetical protein
MDKENWTRQVFDTTLTTNGRGQDMSQPLAHQGGHKQYYGGQKPCCMCGEAPEDWRHIITFKSLDASLHRTESCTKVKKSMKSWRIPPYFWIAIEKGINHYAAHPLKRDKEDMPPESQIPFWDNVLYSAQHITSSIPEAVACGVEELYQRDNMHRMVHIHHTKSRHEQYQERLPIMVNKAYTNTMGPHVPSLDVSQYSSS